MNVSFPPLPSILVIALNAMLLIVPLRLPVTATVSTAAFSPSKAALVKEVIPVVVPPLN